MNKFFQILQILTPAERLRLIKYADSPYFHDTAWLAGFVAAALRLDFGADFNSKNTDFTAFSSILFAAAFPQKTFDTQRYNRLLSDATTFLCDFLSVEHRTDGRPQLATLFLARKQYKRYSSTVAQLHDELQTQPLRDAAFYEKTLEMERISLRYAQTEAHRTERTNLETLHKALDLSFLVKKIRYICEVLSRQQVLQHHYTIEGETLVLDWLQQSNYRTEPAVVVYLCVYDLLKQADLASFEALQTALQTHDKCFAPSEQHELYTYLINFCIREINKGNEAFLRHYLELVQPLLDQKILLLNDEISVASYKNIVTIGLRAGEYERIAAFIQTYSAFLPFAYRTNALTYNLAKLHFTQANYQKVLHYLRDVDYDNLFYALDCRWLQLKTYYALGEENALESVIQSFRVYLLRNKTITTQTKQQYLQLIIVLKKVLLIPHRKPDYAKKLYAEIEAKSIVADKAWLLQAVRNYYTENSSP